MKQEILSFLEEMNAKSIAVNELAQALQRTESKKFTKLVRAVAQLESEEKIAFNRCGNITLPREQRIVEGVFRANERGFGFVTLEEDEPDVFIPVGKTAFAMDEDVVKVEITQSANPFRERGAEGKILEILHHAKHQIVGVFEAYSAEEQVECASYGVVRPAEKKLKDYCVGVNREGILPEKGSVVRVQLTQYASEASPFFMQGVVEKVIGLATDLGMDVLEVVHSRGISPEFPEEVLEEAEKISDVWHGKELVGRRDLRKQMIVTIDGEDAKDLDDAVCVWQKENGNYHLGVHIADVSHYVTCGSALDKEAYERATSIYLADRVIPMISPRLSNGICSLNPSVPRLTMSCEMEINPAGEVRSYELFPSVIQTTERMTYAAVNQILEEEDEKSRVRYEKLVPMFEKMAELHQILEKKRLKRGAIQFEEHEAKLIVDEKGSPVEFQLRERGVSERLIESFMLAANETVAKHFSDRKLPALYRVHEHPKAEKLEKFFDFASMFGIAIQGTTSDLASSELQKVLDSVSGKSEEGIIQTMLLRSMQQARYSENNYGHYGLAAENYTHFTSPIRRYPDLVVHRLIRSYAESAGKKNQERWKEALPEIAQHTSARERRAVEVEREVEAMKKAEYLAQHVGEEFPGVIRSVVKFGFFVELPNTVEGLVHVRTLSMDHFQFLEQQLALIGERTGKVFKVGQEVVIRVVRSEPKLREIDFELISSEEVESEIFSRKKQEKSGRNCKDRRRKKRRKKSGVEEEKPKGKLLFYKKVAKKKKRK